MEKFQVDLAGIVDILSRHLYSSPRVFVRELLQNGIDAVTARRQLEPALQGELTIEVQPTGEVSFTDNGIGLTADEVRDLLSTIGRSSKRDDLGLQREGFLGQFGIGLLSCFLVSDTIEVRTRSARHPDAPTLLWTASGDGTYQLTETDPLPTPGTVTTLQPRRGERWLEATTVKDLLVHYGALLPVPITLSHAGVLSPVAPSPAPWELADDQLTDYCEDAFGFVPLAAIPLEVPVAGITGVAFVLPAAASASSPAKHRVYLRRMLLGEAVGGLVPDWASFVRVVVNVENLRPTASREALYDDEVLSATRKQLGAQLRRWMTRTHAADPELLRRFIHTHRLAVAGAALHDDEVLAIARDWVPWYTTTGVATMSELLRTSQRLHFAATSRTYDELAPIAAARGLTVLNASYTHAPELLRRFAQADPSIDLIAVTLTDLVDGGAHLDDGMRAVVQVASEALTQHYCEAAAREFEPAGTPALYVRDPERAAAARSENRRRSAAADPIFAGLLGQADGDEEEDEPPFDTLVLNLLNPVVQSLPTTEPGLVADVVRHLYATALLTSGPAPSSADRDLLSQTLLTLIERAR